MALDADGRPIPVWVPPPGPPPPPVPPDHVSPHQPDIENDVAMLKTALDNLGGRIVALERFSPAIDEMSSRVAALEEMGKEFAQLAAKFGVVQEAFDGMPSLLNRIGFLETYALQGDARHEMVLSRLDSFEKQLAAAIKARHVDPIPPS